MTKFATTYLKCLAVMLVGVPLILLGFAATGLADMPSIETALRPEVWAGVALIALLYAIAEGVG